MKNLLSLLFITLLFTACSSEQHETLDPSLPKKDFVLEDAALTHYTVIKQGRNVTAKELPGKILLLDIFATWCPACKVEASHLSNIQKTFGKDVQVIGLMIDENQPIAASKTFATKHHASYPISHASDNQNLAARLAADMQQPRQFPIPLLVMYDQKGNYFRHYVGAVPEEMIVRDIQTLLKK